jgi:hypothetical protein
VSDEQATPRTKQIALWRFFWWMGFVAAILATAKAVEFWSGALPAAALIVLLLSKLWLDEASHGRRP